MIYIINTDDDERIEGGIIIMFWFYHQIMSFIDIYTYQNICMIIYFVVRRISTSTH